MRKKSKRSRKSNRVSWASQDDLCQVKLFSSEDCPAIVGLKTRDDLQATTTQHTNTLLQPSDLPPGFDRIVARNQSYASQIQWKCPSEIVLSDTWLVASGEESDEAKHQNLRESRVLEAVYPRISTIPANPCVSSEVDKEYYDDSKTMIVSMIPIEEEEEYAKTLNVVAEPEIPTVREQPSQQPALRDNNLTVSLGKPSDLGPGVANAASVALAEAIRSSNEKGSLIDTDLLIKILSDKNMVQSLIVNGPSTNTVPSSSSFSEPRTTANPLLSMPIPPRPAIQETRPRVLQQVVTPPLHSMPIPEPSVVSLPSSLNGTTFRMMPNQVRPDMTAMTVQTPNAIQPVKDANYYKNLIRQHGEVKEEFKVQNGPNQYHHTESKPGHNFKLGGESKTNSKLCMFFNSPKGCMKGPSCPFRHDVTPVQMQWQGGNVMESHRSKRMKLGGKMNGGMLV